jgi:hypothetical protein
MKYYLLIAAILIASCKEIKNEFQNNTIEQYFMPSVASNSNQSDLWTVVKHKNTTVWLKSDPVYSLTDSIKDVRIKQAENVKKILDNLKYVK